MGEETFDYVYSYDGENFDYHDIQYACDSAGVCDDSEEFTIYRGVKKKIDAKSLMPFRYFIKHIDERTYELAGDIYSGWLERLTANTKMEEEFYQLIDGFMAKYNVSPDFYSVVDVKEFKIKLVGGEVIEINEQGEVM